MQLTTANPMKHIIKMLKSPITYEKLEKQFDVYESSIKNEISELETRKSTVARDKESDKMYGSSANISEEIVFKKQLLKDRHKWTICIPSQFGSVNVSTAWADKYSYLDKRLFALLLCGLELEFDNLELDNAIVELKPKPFHVIDNIAGMYGRNVQSCAEVKIFGKDIAWDTIAQAAARAGREKSDNAIVSLYIDRELLDSDPRKNSIRSLKQCINDLNRIEIGKDRTSVQDVLTRANEEDIISDSDDEEEDEVVAEVVADVVAVVAESSSDEEPKVVPVNWEDCDESAFTLTSDEETGTSSDAAPKKKRLTGSARRANKNRRKKKAAAAEVHSPV